jgi:hypothetical protein
MSEQQARTAMDDGDERVGRELRVAVNLICRSGGGVVFEEFPGALQQTPAPGADGGAEESWTRAARDPDAAARDVLLASATALAETLARLDAVAAQLRPRLSRSTTS